MNRGVSWLTFIGHRDAPSLRGVPVTRGLWAGAFPIEGGEILMMEEALIWLRERRSDKLVPAFLETARSVSPV